MEIEAGAIVAGILFLWLGSMEIRLRGKISKGLCDVKSGILTEIAQRLFRIESKMMGG